MALTITDSTLKVAKELAEAGDVAGAWNILSCAGDHYAANAYDIIKEINNPTSVFANIVQSHWDKVAPNTRESEFMEVGIQHVRQYLSFVNDQKAGFDEYGEQLYLVPNVRDVEACYYRVWCLQSMVSGRAFCQQKSRFESHVAIDAANRD